MDIQNMREIKNPKEYKPPNLIGYKHFGNFKKDKLLVLDIDKTLCNFDQKSYNSTNPVISRPHLHKFLKDVSQHYELAVWSATSFETIMAKMASLNIRNNKCFKIRFVLDKHSMKIVKKTSFRKCKLAKPLSVIWKKCSRFNSTNTIILDDFPVNFHFNPQNGLEIVPYEQNMSTSDNELVKIGEYLIKLAKYCDNFTTVKHSDFKNYNPNPSYAKRRNQEKI